MENKLRLIFILFFISSAVQASGQASGQSKETYFDEPVACLKKGRFPCAIRLTSHSKLNVANIEFISDLGSSILFKSAKELQVLEGAFWISSQEDINIKYPLYTFKSQGDVWIEKKKDNSVWIKNLDSKIAITGKYLISEHSLPAGFENWYGGINQLLQVQQGMIKPFEKKTFLREFLSAFVYDGNRAKQLMIKYKNVWQASVAESSELYQKIVIRQMASFKEIRETEDLKQQKKQRLQADMQAMYRRRFYNGQ